MPTMSIMTATSTAPTTMEKGSILMQKYELGTLLGQGTFAKVYCAKHLASGQSVAIKVIDKEKILKVGLINQIKREISVMRLVKHPNVVELYEVMASKTKIYFVMEYVKGGELFAKISKGRLKEGEARKYFQQLVGAIDFCHSRGVYHRDLKPENLLLDEHGNLKITDFGLSALHDSRRQDGLLHTTCGTPAYVAPEVINQKGYDGAKADIWSCGVVLYVLLAGFLPFHDINLMELYKKISRGDFRCPAWFSVEVRKLLAEILEPHPVSRITVRKVKQNRWFKEGFGLHLQISPVNTSATQFLEQNNLIGSPSTPRDVRAAFRIDPDGSSGRAPIRIDTRSLSSPREGGIITRREEAYNDEQQHGGIVQQHRGIVQQQQQEQQNSKVLKPTSLNAFEIISSLSPGFDLRRLFEMDLKESRFTTAKSPEVIISRFEEVAKTESRFAIEKSIEGMMQLRSNKEGRKGQLKINAEIFEVAPTLRVVEVKKVAGDTIEYNDFCKQDLRPALKDIVWIWQEHQQPSQGQVVQ